MVNRAAYLQVAIGRAAREQESMDRDAYLHAVESLTKARLERARYTCSNWTNRWDETISGLVAAISFTDKVWAKSEDAGYETPY